MIAPGDFMFYSGKLWPEWRGQALAAGMAHDGAGARLADRRQGHARKRATRCDKRIRDIVEAPDGSLYVIEDGAGGRLLHLTPAG